MKRALALGMVCLAALGACGDDGDEIPTEILPPEAYYAQCVAPRTGTDPTTGKAYDDEKGSLTDELLFLRSWIDDTYLWYSEVPQDLDVKSYKDPVDYFDALRTTAITASGKDKDEFHFTYSTEEWVAMSVGGSSAGYGVDWALIAKKPPRKLVAAVVIPGSPADKAGLKRGTEVLAIDGVDFVNGSDTATLNEGMFPSELNQAHAFTLRDVGATETKMVSITSASVTLQPVQNVKVLPGADKIGYLLFTDHIATAEKALIDAITTLKSQGISDLVLDLRYNGGGYLDIAAELAYMIAPTTSTSGKTFELTSFNDKHQDKDIFGRTLEPTPFWSTSQGFSTTSGQALPNLGLTRVFVLTTKSTCSASEAVMNGLAGVGVEVIQIGNTTCGKPYGFYPQDNCGVTYFAIQFQGVNAKGFGDYADGFAPGGVNPGCVVNDDYNHQLGDPAEAMLAAALAYRTTKTCPAAVAPTVERTVAHSGPAVRDPKSFLRQNRILRAR